jgi:hypothetical protein
MTFAACSLILPTRGVPRRTGIESGLGVGAAIG